LSPDLRPGALLVAREVRDEDSGAPPPDAAWVARVLRLGGAEAGTVLSTARILGSTAAKAAARARLAGDGPAAVDLESAAFARVAAARRAPYVVLRAVCDTAREELPVDLERCRDGSGAIRRLDVVRQAMLHPASALALWRLRQRLDDGARALARLVAALLVDAEAPR
jgi:nucleoside phosphorylase